MVWRRYRALTAVVAAVAAAVAAVPTPAAAAGMVPGQTGCPSWAQQPQLTQAYEQAIDDALAAKTDVLGDQQLSRPGGPTYASLSDTLTPIMYAIGPRAFGNGYLTDSGVYYVPFGIPAGPTSRGSIALHVADGSQVITDNAYSAARRSTDVYVGAEGSERYGECLADLAGPELYQGYLPALETGYVDHDGVAYTQESFAAYLPGTQDIASFIKITAQRGRSDAAATTVRVRDSQPDLSVSGDRLTANGLTYLYFSPGASFDAGASSLSYPIDLSDGAVHSVYVVRVNEAAATPDLLPGEAAQDAARSAMEAYWNGRLAAGAGFSVPETYAMNAEKALLIQNLLMTWRYSLGNAYEAFYQPESSDAVQALGEYGFTDVYRAALQDLLAKTKGANRRNWEIGEKLYHAVDYWWLTGDASLIDSNLAAYQGYAQDLADQHAADPNHLLQPQQYSSDIKSTVYGLHQISTAWRGLSVMSSAWGQTGHQGLQAQYAPVAASLHDGLEAAIVQSRQALPDGSLFTPAILLYGEQPYDQLTATSLGGYWNLVAPYGFAAGVYAPGSPDARATLRYIYDHGGRLLGLLRANNSADNTVYQVEQDRFLADNDQADQLVLSFYAKLAAGMTKNTFVAGEAANVGPLAAKWPDCRGKAGCVYPDPSTAWTAADVYRGIYNSPNSANNSMYLDLLRNLLVHRVVDAAGEPTGLQLAYSTPRSWLDQGKKVSVTAAPTAFGPLTYSITSDVTHHHVHATVEVPSRSPMGALSLRLRVPGGLRMSNVHVNGQEWKAFDPSAETVDLTAASGTEAIDVSYADAPAAR